MLTPEQPEKSEDPEFAGIGRAEGWSVETGGKSKTFYTNQTEPVLGGQPRG